MTAARVLVVLFALVVLGIGALVGFLMLGESSPLSRSPLGGVADPLAPVNPDDSSKQTFTVAPGASAAQIGDELQKRGLVRSGLAFRLLAEQQGVGGTLAAGDYELSPSMSSREILEVLARGQVKRGLVATLPEGWRAEQIADRLEATGFASRAEFLSAVGNPASVPGGGAILTPPPPTLEGFLFPETYEVPQRVPGAQAASLMLRMFSQRIDDQLQLGPTDPLKLSPREVLTLASIVEREAQVPGERATIASVYLNRLSRDMPLQADPTVQYAVATRDGPSASAYDYWKPTLSQADLDLSSPYNTYLHPGLPPGPICNPGLASIQAAVHPAQTDYLYFVAREDGSGTHLFARTLAEHNDNVSRVAAEKAQKPN